MAITYNRATGKADIAISGDKIDFKCESKNIKLDVLTSMGIEFKRTEQSSAVRIDNVELITRPVSDVEYWIPSGTDPMDTVAGVDTNGGIISKNGSKMLQLSSFGYVEKQNNYLENSNAFFADLYIDCPIEMAVKGNGTELVAFTGDFKIMLGSAVIGKYQPYRTYTICVAYNRDASAQYVSVAEDSGRLVGYTKMPQTGSVPSLRIENSYGYAYVDNVGFIETGNVLGAYCKCPKNNSDSETGYAEFVFPSFIDTENIDIRVNGKKAESTAAAGKTIMIPELNTDSYYNVSVGGYDLYGNTITAKSAFVTPEDVVRISLKDEVLVTGENIIDFVLR